MSNSHYVPMQTLRKFTNNKLSIFNVRTGKFKENVKLEKSFSEENFYSSEIEDKLNKKIESQFGSLFSNMLLNAKDKIELKRNELLLIKKFLLVSVIRSMGSEELTNKESKYYELLNQMLLKTALERNIGFNPVEPPFIEKKIENETPFDYWMRTLNVILDSDGTPESILKDENKTYPAYRRSQVINNGYLTFWDSEFDSEEFVITDIGMTSENEKGWNGVTVHNTKKSTFLLSLLNQAKSQTEIYLIKQILDLHSDFTENFMMFPISSKRMILLIDPFYKFRIVNFNRYNMPSLIELSNLTNEKLYYPNDVKYVLPQNPLKPHIYHPDDLYIYNISKLTKNETIYCNELFLDRIDTNVGFSNLDKVKDSFIKYYKDTLYPHFARNDYTELYELINERYGTNIDINAIKGERR